jgi:hypothetical protein
MKIAALWPMRVFACVALATAAIAQPQTQSNLPPAENQYVDNNGAPLVGGLGIVLCAEYADAEGHLSGPVRQHSKSDIGDAPGRTFNSCRRTIGVRRRLPNRPLRLGGAPPTVYVPRACFSVVRPVGRKNARRRNDRTWGHCNSATCVSYYTAMRVIPKPSCGRPAPRLPAEREGTQRGVAPGRPMPPILRRDRRDRIRGGYRQSYPSQFARPLLSSFCTFALLSGMSEIRLPENTST